MKDVHLRALQYIQNTDGRAMLDDFVDDHEPVGTEIWSQLASQRLVYLDSGQMVRLTRKGEEALLHPPKATSA
jgi:hypothetical protein